MSDGPVHRRISRHELSVLTERAKQYACIHWRLLLISQTLLLQILIKAPNYILVGRPRINGDGIFFLYSGRSWASNGVIPYHNLIDIKPPLTHEFTALLSIISGGDPYLQALLASITTSGAIIGTVVIVGQLAYRQSSDARAAYAAGTCVLLYPNYYAYPGFRPKYFTIAFGLLSIWLLVRERSIGAGACAAIAAGFWQFGLGFPVLVLGQTVIRREWSAAIRAVSGIAAVTVAVIAPIAAAGTMAVGDMIEQVIFYPIIASENTPFIERITDFVAILGPATSAVIIGMIGSLLPGAIAGKRIVLRQPRQQSSPALWLSVLTAWFLLQVFHFDLDAGMDLLPLLSCCALGYGVLFRVFDDHMMLGLLIGVTFVAGLVSAGLFDAVIHPVQVDSVGSMGWRYWEGVSPSSGCFIKEGFRTYLTGPAKDVGLPSGSTCGSDLETLFRIAIGLQ